MDRDEKHTELEAGTNDGKTAQPPIRQATLDALGSRFIEDVGRCVVPIFRDHRAAPESVGTGFLLHTGRDHVLVTAAHVLDRIKGGTRYYFYAAPKLKRATARVNVVAASVMRPKPFLSPQAAPS